MVASNSTKWSLQRYSRHLYANLKWKKNRIRLRYPTWPFFRQFDSFSTLWDLVDGRWNSNRMSWIFSLPNFLIMLTLSQTQIFSSFELRLTRAVRHSESRTQRPSAFDVSWSPHAVVKFSILRGMLQKHSYVIVWEKGGESVQITR